MKYFKYILITIAALLLIGFIYLKYVVGEDEPTIVENKNATSLADNMFIALNRVSS